MYKKLLGWEVYNFMSFDHARVDFDETGIINIKGYNHSGKSALEVALRVLFMDYHPQKQVRYIKTGSDYFRIVGYFEDNIRVIRDKYKNGNSLYEVYQGDALIFSTKVNGVLTRVSGVPEPLVKFFGLVQYEDMCFNIRSCFEKGIGTETSGSENYKALSTVLMSAEIAAAGISLNKDKNKCGGEISVLESQIGVYDGMLEGKVILSDEVFDYLDGCNRDIEAKEARIVELDEMRGIVESLSEVEACLGVSHLESVDAGSLRVLSDAMMVSGRVRELSDAFVGTFDLVDAGGLSLLSEMMGVSARLSGLDDEVVLLDELPMGVLLSGAEDIRRYHQLVDDIAVLESEVSSLREELASVVGTLEREGHLVNKCPDCGCVYLDGGIRGHEHN